MTQAQYNVNPQGLPPSSADVADVAGQKGRPTKHLHSPTHCFKSGASLVPTPRAPPGERVGSGVDETRVVSSHEV